jgi:hypothetical protein
MDILVEDISNFIRACKDERIPIVKVKDELVLKDCGYVRFATLTAFKRGVSMGIYYCRVEGLMKMIKDRLMLEGFWVSDGEWTSEVVEDLLEMIRKEDLR